MKHYRIFSLLLICLYISDTKAQGINETKSDSIGNTTRSTLAMESLGSRSPAASRDNPDKPSSLDAGTPWDTIWVSTNGQDGHGCGSRSNPCQSPSAAIDNCEGNCLIVLEWGIYSLQQTLTLPDGASLQGGFYDGHATDYQSTINAPPGGAPAIAFVDVTSPVLLSNLILRGSASDTATPSIVVSVVGSSNISFAKMNIYGGKGGDGINGKPGQDGVDGKNGGDGSSNGGGAGGGEYIGGTGAARQTGDFVDGCSVECCYGATSTSGQEGGGTMDGGAGGDNASPFHYAFGSHPNADPGGNGQSVGNQIDCAQGGSASSDSLGYFDNNFKWRYVGGTSGNHGLGGPSGGGGGAGGAAFYCGVFSNDKYPGGAGGGGGAGGSGGTGGFPGGSGMPSFGIVLITSSITVDSSVTITGNRSGNGGNGGNGGAGGKGGFGGKGEKKNNDDYKPVSNGGDGGHGGDGSSGSGGAGGNSGPAICIAMQYSSTIEGKPTYSTGTPGTPGTGGKGAKNCDGQNGIRGSVQEIMDYDH